MIDNDKIAENLQLGGARHDGAGPPSSHDGRDPPGIPGGSTACPPVTPGHCDVAMA